MGVRGTGIKSQKAEEQRNSLNKYETVFWTKVNISAATSRKMNSVDIISVSTSHG